MKAENPPVVFAWPPCSTQIASISSTSDGCEVRAIAFDSQTDNLRPKLKLCGSVAIPQSVLLRRMLDCNNELPAEWRDTLNAVTSLRLQPEVVNTSIPDKYGIVSPHAVIGGWPLLDGDDETLRAYVYFVIRLGPNLQSYNVVAMLPLKPMLPVSVHLLCDTSKGGKPALEAYEHGGCIVGARRFELQSNSIVMCESSQMVLRERSHRFLGHLTSASRDISLFSSQQVSPSASASQYSQHATHLDTVSSTISEKRIAPSQVSYGSSQRNGISASIVRFPPNGFESVASESSESSFNSFWPNSWKSNIDDKLVNIATCVVVLSQTGTTRMHALVGTNSNKVLYFSGSDSTLNLKASLSLSGTPIRIDPSSPNSNGTVLLSITFHSTANGSDASTPCRCIRRIAANTFSESRISFVACTLDIDEIRDNMVWYSQRKRDNDGACRGEPDLTLIGEYNNHIFVGFSDSLNNSGQEDMILMKTKHHKWKLVTVDRKGQTNSHKIELLFQTPEGNAVHQTSKRRAKKSKRKKVSEQVSVDKVAYQTKKSKVPHSSTNTEVFGSIVASLENRLKRGETRMKLFSQNAKSKALLLQFLRSWLWVLCSSNLDSSYLQVSNTTIQKLLDWADDLPGFQTAYQERLNGIPALPAEPASFVVTQAELCTTTQKLTVTVQARNVMNDMIASIGGIGGGDSYLQCVNESELFLLPKSTVSEIKCTVALEFESSFENCNSMMKNIGSEVVVHVFVSTAPPCSSGYVRSFARLIGSIRVPTLWFSNCASITLSDSATTSSMWKHLCVLPKLNVSNGVMLQHETHQRFGNWRARLVISSKRGNLGDLHNELSNIGLGIKRSTNVESDQRQTGIVVANNPRLAQVLVCEVSSSKLVVVLKSIATVLKSKDCKVSCFTTRGTHLVQSALSALDRLDAEVDFIEKHLVKAKQPVTLRTALEYKKVQTDTISVMCELTLLLSSIRIG